MKYYRHLYLEEGLEKKKEKIISKLEKNKLQRNTHLIVLSANEKNHLDIIHSAFLLQPGYPGKNRLVVGIAGSYDGALELVKKIAGDVYKETGDVDIRNYIMSKEQGD